MNQNKHQRIRLGRDNLGTRFQVMLSLLSVQNVEKSLLREEICWDITDLNMKVSSILVISVIIKLQREVVFRDIFSVSTNSTDHRITFWSWLSHSNIIPLWLIIVVSPLFYEIHFYILLFLLIPLWWLRGLKFGSDIHGPLGSDQWNFIISTAEMVILPWSFTGSALNF